MRLAIIHARELATDPALLSELERGALTAIRGERRRDEWIRGRLAIHRLLGPEISVLVDADGAPRPLGGSPCSVSLSHDGGWFAVAVADGRSRIGIDLCRRSHGDRVARILRWLGVRGEPIDPIVAWTALEAVLKLRRLSIEALRDRALDVEARNAHVVVRGIGDDAVVRWRTGAEHVVSWTREAA